MNVNHLALIKSGIHVVPLVPQLVQHLRLERAHLLVYSLLIRHTGRIL